MIAIHYPVHHRIQFVDEGHTPYDEGVNVKEGPPGHLQYPHKTPQRCLPGVALFLFRFPWPLLSAMTGL